MSNTTLEEDIAVSDKKHPAPKSVAPPVSRWQPYKKPALIIAGIVATVFVIFYSIDSFTHEETDDAYITGHLHNISSRINAVVTEVEVKDNEKVKKGQVLVKLDPSEYIALVAAAQANLSKASADFNRQQPLVALHAISDQDLDATRATRAVDLAQLDLAELQVQYSTIYAPADGYIGR